MECFFQALLIVDFYGMAPWIVNREKIAPEL